MPRKTCRPEEIITRLRKADVLLVGGADGLARSDRPKRPASRREKELEEQVEDLRRVARLA